MGSFCALWAQSGVCSFYGLIFHLWLKQQNRFGGLLLNISQLCVRVGRLGATPRRVPTGVLGPSGPRGTGSQVPHGAETPVWGHGRLLGAQALLTLIPTQAAHPHQGSEECGCRKGWEPPGGPHPLQHRPGVVPQLRARCGGAGGRGRSPHRAALKTEPLGPPVSSPQFRRFQEVTLTHLQGIASHYNLSFDIEARFQSLAHESRAVALALNQSQAAVQDKLGHLRTWVRRTQRRGRKADHRLLALSAAMSKGSARRAREQERQRAAVSGLARDVRALQDALLRLTPLVQSQSTRLAALEGQLRLAGPSPAARNVTPDPSRPSNPSAPQLQGGGQMIRAPPEPRDPPLDFAYRLQGAQEPLGLGNQQAWPPESPGEGKHHTRSPPSVSTSPSGAFLALSALTPPHTPPSKKGTAQEMACLQVRPPGTPMSRVLPAGSKCPLRVGDHTGQGWHLQPSPAGSFLQGWGPGL